MFSIDPPKKKLSVVIPTTLRRNSILATLESLGGIGSADINIEVVVNNANPDTNLISKILEFKNVFVRRSSETWPTAESSALAAAHSSDAEWVWILGDDDLATPTALLHVLSLIESNAADFWLLNIKLRQGASLAYYSIEPEVLVTSSFELWRQMGFVSITTTLSAFLLRKSVIDWQMFERFHSIQGIYSHSFSLFCMLQGKRVGATNHYCVDRNESDSAEIGQSLESYQLTIGRSLDFIWTKGLNLLIREASIISGIRPSILWSFREHELIKIPGQSHEDGTPFDILIGPTISVYLRKKLQSKLSHQILARLPFLKGRVKKAPVTIKFENAS